ncbi:two-component sensor histidine kinase [Sphingobacterium shayense]|uniref:sensor histidine kinase n=1 Tax=Sphingobacterium shayense TaxID=626343 RepID=UPI001556B92D|nr:ATP-binding protein [Sphingobacterium shayense]NQD72072.1 two-component sensor histidine kinase [Sphingobacterium shayense]
MRTYNKLLYTLIGILVIYTVTFVVFIFYSVTNFAFSDFYKRLDLRREITANRVLDTKREGVEWSKNYIEELFNQTEFVIELNHKNGIKGDNYLDPSIWRKIDKAGPTNFKVGNKFYSTSVYFQNNKRYIIGISAENYFYSHHLAYLRSLLIISLVLGILFVIVVSLLVKRSFIKPVHRLIGEVEKFSSENLFLRLNEDREKGVLQKLAQTFNRMLNRIETSFETQKNFISNASHELNTPLTTIIGIADLALSKDRSVEQYQQSLKKILVSSENLERKTRALLMLAQTGYQNNTLKFTPVRIDQIIMDAEIAVKDINSKFHIKTDFSMLPEDSMKLKVNGSSALLQLAISNLVSNACKYSENHTAYVALGAVEKGVIILIKDKGIGIPEEELKFVYDPYFRASNVSFYSGYGIGLPLARNIIQMHEGKLTISSELAKGTTVRIELPTGKF